MNFEKLSPGRGTPLRKNTSQKLTIKIIQGSLKDIFMINGSSFLTKNITKNTLIISPDEYYMIINKSDGNKLELYYDHEISTHQVVYQPYKYEHEEKIPLKEEDLIKQFDIPIGYIDVLPKWYSFKFSYPDFNLIFIKPSLGISFQSHDNRNESWEIIKGKPIIIVGNQVYYNVDQGMEFEVPIKTIHSIINANIKDYVLIKEKWTGIFNEKDINRIFNPNNYF